MSQTQETINNSNPDFISAFNGKFSGVLRWPQVDDLWLNVKKQKDQDWYLYAVGEQPPTESSSGDALEKFIDELDKLLRKEHEEDYCGIIYADDIETPGFIKIFDPNNIGTSCSMALKGPLPGWIISKIKPTDLEEAMKPTASRRRWWQKIIK